MDVITQLKCIPASLWSWDDVIDTPQGIAKVEFGFLKDRGAMASGRLEVIVLPDTTYQIQHQTLSGDWFLQSQQDNDSQEPFAQAHEPNPL